MLDSGLSVSAMCDCGAPADANGRECVRCWRARIRSVSLQGPTFDDHVGVMRPGEFRAKAMDGTATKRWDATLEDYASVRKEGSQPATTQQRDIDRAKRVSDETGQPFSARSGQA
jgi:hypothetical protein